MDQKLYDVAEEAYQQYDKSNEIGGELLLNWFLAEIHFVGTVTEVVRIQLGGWPANDLEHTLVIRIAHVYREIRQGVKRATFAKSKIDMQAEKSKEP